MPLTMSINLTQIKLRDLFDEYVNSDEDGVIGYHGRLDIRPKYQREFIYGEKEQVALLFAAESLDGGGVYGNPRFKGAVKLG